MTEHPRQTSGDTNDDLTNDPFYTRPSTSGETSGEKPSQLSEVPHSNTEMPQVASMGHFRHSRNNTETSTGTMSPREFLKKLPPCVRYTVYVIMITLTATTLAIQKYDVLT